MHTQPVGWVRTLRKSSKKKKEHYGKSETVRNDDGLRHHNEPATTPNRLQSYTSECRHAHGRLAHSLHKWVLPLEHWIWCAQGADIVAQQTTGSQWFQRFLPGLCMHLAQMEVPQSSPTTNKARVSCPFAYMPHRVQTWQQGHICVSNELMKQKDVQWRCLCGPWDPWQPIGGACNPRGVERAQQAGRQAISGEGFIIRCEIFRCEMVGVRAVQMRCPGHDC